MSKGIALVGVAVVLLVAGLLYTGAVTPTGGGYKLHVPFEFVAIDLWAGGTDATSTKALIYDTNFEPIETVTISTASGTASANKYWSGDYVYIWIDDTSDTSLCHQYLKLMVPYHSVDTDTKHYVTLDTVDTDAAWNNVCEISNGTIIATSGTYDVSQSGSAPTLVFKVLTPTDDKGYVTTWNFKEGCNNAAYYVFKVSGTGSTRVVFDTATSLRHYYDGAFHWYCIQLNDEDITRNLLSSGKYDPIGYYTLPIKLDLTQVTAGDSVTFLHGLYYYSDFDYLISAGSWGPDSASVTETFTITP